jgi:hypothetical protein
MAGRSEIDGAVVGDRVDPLMPVSEREIWACANTLIKQHGQDAWFHAAQRADELGARGDIAGQRTFLRILRRIETLTDAVPAGAVH